MHTKQRNHADTIHPGENNTSLSPADVVFDLFGV